MTRQILTALGVAWTCACGQSSAATPVPAQGPNILFILADDLGWRDVACFGSTFHETPRIDALAGRGMRFTQAYAANPLCSPTRASIVTGLYPARVGITAPACHVPQEKLEERIVDKGPPQNRALQADSATRLKTDYVTIAELLKGAGYRTAHFGKWHLGPEPYSPLQQGFDIDVPHWAGPGPPGAYTAPWKSPKFAMPAKPGEHIEDLLAAEAVKFIRENKGQPFLMHYWAFSVHAPYQSKAALLPKYLARAKTLPPDAPQRNPLYAAMVECLDTAVGQLIRAIDEAGIADRTVIIFFSDNGGVNWDAMGEKKAKGGGGGEGTAQAAPFAGIPPTSNAPLRGGKASIYEGGTREPCIVVWPGVTRPGSRSEAIIQSVDFLPTLLEICGVERPAGMKLDGRSFVPALRGEPHDRGPTFCHFPHYTPASGAIPCTWVRSGEWKLLRLFADNEDQTDRFELYNLNEDIGESHNLAERHPDKVRDLNALIDGFLRDSGAVIPRANPPYNKGGASAAAAGWTGNPDLALSVKGGRLILRSGGKDPYMSSRDASADRGPLTVEIRMKSSLSGPGQVFWAKGKKLSFLGNHINFAPEHDAQWHEYTVTLPIPGGLDALRIDPASGPGEGQIEWIRLKGPDGALINEWRF
ncbi:MAG TPA: sulfatase [Verrucomicrobiae bacterium]|nr:sulfatase [Verrucomicrobiae bacterium]